MSDNINNSKTRVNGQSQENELAIQIDDINDELELNAQDLSEIEAIQAAIEEGDAPIEDIETAAGEEGDGGSSSAVDFSRDGSETLASSEFKTASFAFNSINTNLTDTNNVSFNVTTDDTPTSGTATTNPGTTSSTETSTTLRAQFTDNFVSGVTFNTSSGLTGKTGDGGVAGEFRYNEGDTITFTIGDVVIGQFKADAITGDILFLQDIAGTSLSDSNSSHVENMAIFLQALDEDLIDDDSADGSLNTHELINQASSYETNITIKQAMHDAFTGYIDPTTGAVLDITTSGKEMISQALGSVGIEFTRETERDESGDGENTFETVAMDHVAQTIETLAGERAPESVDQRQVDTIEVPGGLINYHFAEADGVITFTTDDLLQGAVGQQVITANLVVKNVTLSADFESIGLLVDLGDGNYEIQLNDAVTGKDLEGLAIDYRVEDWTVSREVTSQTLDNYKSHLSANIDDVKEDAGFNQFTLNSSLTFETNTQLQINFTSELLSEQLTNQLQQELQSLGKDAVIVNGIIQIAEYADDYTVPLEYSNDGGETWQLMSVVAIDTTGSIPRPIFGFELAAGNNSLEIRVPIFDDVVIEPTEYFRAEINGDAFYDETILFAIEDNDSIAPELPTIDIDYVLVTEGQGDAIFTLTLNKASDEVVTVNYSTAELSANFGSDFENSTGTVEFQPGETTATISIKVVDDLISEGSPEFALINLSDATNAIINDAQGTLRIFDNDYPLEISVSAPAINEGEQAIFTVDITKDLGEIADSLTLVNLSLSDGTATDGADYDSSSLKVFYGEASDPQYLESDGKGNYIVPIGVTSLSVLIDTINDDNHEKTESFTLTAKVGNSEATGSIKINDNDDNKPPTITADDGSMDEDSGSITVTYDAQDSDGTISSTVATVVAEQGEVVVNGDGTYTFTPAKNFNGDATITFVTTDDYGDTATTTSTISVEPVTDLSAENDSATTQEDVPVDGTVADNDSTLSGGVLSFAATTNPANGSVVMQANGDYTYTPAANFHGNDSFTYTVTDVASGESLIKTVNITVGAVTDLSAENDSATTQEDVPVDGTVADNDSTLSGGAVKFCGHH